MGCLEKQWQIWDWIHVSHSCRRQGPVAPGASTAGTGGAAGASWHWFVKEGSISDGNHDETVRALAGSHSALGDAKHEGQDWAHIGGSKGDKMPMNSGRSCHRTIARADASRKPSLCSQVGGTVPAVTGPSPGHPHSPSLSSATPAAILGARSRARLRSPAGHGVLPAGGELPLEGPGQHCPAAGLSCPRV